jgi:uncharacterized membrane protein
MPDVDTPTATEVYRFAWHPLKAYFPELFLVALVWTAFAIPSGAMHHAHHPGIAALYDLLVMVPLNFGGLYVYLRAARAETPRVGDLFEGFRSAYRRTILAHILFMALVGLGLVLLVVPGIIVATRLAFVGFLVVDERLDAPSAVRESWRRTRGHAGTIFLVWLLGLPLLLAGLVLLGVGIIPAVMWIHLAFATLFAGVTASEPGTAAAGFATAAR